MTETLSVGFTYSNTGRYRSRGIQVYNALKLWQRFSRESGPFHLDSTSYRPELTAYDDESDPETTRQLYRRLIDREKVDLLLGPYSSGLTLQALREAQQSNRVLWNHGGASDQLYRLGYRRLVSVLSPSSDYFREVPELLNYHGISRGPIAVISSTEGSFASEVRDGLTSRTECRGFDIFTEDFEPSPATSLERLMERADRVPSVVLVVASYDRDLKAIEDLRRYTSSSGPMLGCVAAGVGSFQQELHEQADGVIGPVQWDPRVSFAPRIGPSSKWFQSNYRSAYGEDPDYPAVQAFAGGLIIGEVLRRAGTLRTDRIMKEVNRLKTKTLFGQFNVNNENGRQVGHRMKLVQWQNQRREVVWPNECRTAKLKRK